MSIQGEGFSRDMSLMLKGVGILMMIWHHCFMKYSLFDDYYTRLCFLTVSQGSHIAEFCKICVTMFAFVSGYGLYQAYKQKSSKENASRWIVRRYIKGFAPFWFVYMLSLIAYALYNGKPTTLYFKNNILSGLLYVILDFLGLANLFGTATLNLTWWYMSAYFQYIIIFPLLFCIIEKYGSLLLVLLVLIFPRLIRVDLDVCHMLTFLLSIVLGMAFNKDQIFEKIDAATKNKKAKLLAITALTVLSCILYKASILLQDKRFYDVIWNLFPTVFIILFYLVIPYLRLSQKLLKLIGIHATNIFLIHIFVRDIYFRCIARYVYLKGHFFVIMAILLLVCLALSHSIEALKKFVKYPTAVKKVDNIFAIY